MILLSTLTNHYSFSVVYPDMWFYENRINIPGYFDFLFELG